MVEVEGDDSFKRPGAVPFKWEVRPGVPKTRPGGDDHPPTLLQPPKKLAPLRLKPFPPSNLPSPSKSRSRPVSPFAPPSSFKLKTPPSNSDSHCSGPPPPYSRSSSLRAVGSLPRCFFPKSLFWSKKSKSGEIKKTVQESSSSSSSSSSSELENFYETKSTFSPPEGSRRGSVSSRWSSPKWSSSPRRGSPVKRTASDLGSCEKKSILMMAHSRLG